MNKLNEFHELLLIVIIWISAIVLFLLVYVVIRFNKKANPIPSKFSHNTFLEFMWTLFPILVLILIAIPSMRVLYYMDEVPESEMTLKVIGYQWYWGYQYPDHGNIAFDSYMIPDSEIKPGQLRLLEVDNRIVLPVDTVVKIQITGADVIHGFAVPSFGIKMDAIPGRLNETWVKINKPGVYYGQCSELCGVNHGFMPIVIEAVSKDKFEEWVKKAKLEFSNNNHSQIKLAAN